MDGWTDGSMYMCIYIYTYIYIPYVWWLCRKIFDVVICRRGEQEKSSREGAFCSSSCLPSSRHSGLWLPVPLSGVNVSWLRVWWLSFYGFVVGFLFRCQESVVYFVTFVLHFLSLSLCLLDVILDFSQQGCRFHGDGATCGPSPPKSGPRRKVTANKIINNITKMSYAGSGK